MADQIDRQMLEMIEQGQTLRAVGKATDQGETTVKNRRDWYREAGAIRKDGSVDWKKFEEMEPMKRRRTGKKEVKVTSSKEAAVLVKREPLPASMAGGFTAEEVEELREMLKEREELKGRSAMRSGKSAERSTTVRLDAGLLEAIEEWKERAGVRSLSEAFNQAIEALLNR